MPDEYFPIIITLGAALLGYLAGEMIVSDPKMVEWFPHLHHLQELVGFRPEEQFDSTTVGGLAAEWLGRVPRAGEAVDREGIRIEIMAADDRRVERVRILRAPETESQKEHPAMEEKRDA